VEEEEEEEEKEISGWAVVMSETCTHILCQLSYLSISANFKNKLGKTLHFCVGKSNHVSQSRPAWSWASYQGRE